MTTDAGELMALARECADDLINICEAAQRVAHRTGNTFVLDRQRVAAMIAGKFSRIAASQPDREAVARIIDPHNWHVADLALKRGGLDELEYATKLTASSLRRADAILSLLSVQVDGEQKEAHATKPSPSSTSASATETAFCQCIRCLDERDVSDGEFLGKRMPASWSRMVVCATCGNKRCPHATDHRNVCTNSNEPGQVGSVYGVMPPVAETDADAPGDAGAGDDIAEQNYRDGLGPDGAR